MSDTLHIDGKAYLPLGSAAELYGFAEGELNALAPEGHVRLKKMGKKTYVELSSLQTYLNPPPAPEVPEPEPEPAPISPLAPISPIPISGDTISRHEGVSHPSPIRPPILHKKPSQKGKTILPYFTYAGVALLLLVVFAGSGYVAITRYGPGTVDSSYIAAVGVTGEQSFGDYFRSFLRNLFGIKEPQPVLDWPEIAEKPRPAPPPIAIQRPASSTPAAAPPQTPRPAAAMAPRQSAAAKIVERVIERIIERPSPVLSSGITETYLEGKLSELRNTLTSRTFFNTQVGATHSSLESSISGLQDSLQDSFSTAKLIVSGTSALKGALSVTSSATSTFSNGIEIAAGCFSVNGTCLTSGSGTVGSGSATNLAFYAAGGTTLTATSTLSLTLAGNFGVGTTSPFRKLSVTDTVAAAQFALSYDTSRATQFQTDASGDLVIDPSGNDVLLSDDNLLACDDGCATSPSGAGNVLAENKIGIGTTTPAYKLAIESSDSTSNFLQVASTTNQSILVLNSAGKFGLGTSTPFHQLSLGSGAIVTTEFGLTDGSTIAVDWSRGNQQYVTLGGNRTITFTNYLGGQILRLFVCQDSTGSRTVTWPSVILWEGGSAPTLTTTANKCDIVNLVASVATSSALKVYGAAVLAF